jgi:hypothetical protein
VTEFFKNGTFFLDFATNKTIKKKINRPIKPSAREVKDSIMSLDQP